MVYSQCLRHVIACLLSLCYILTLKLTRIPTLFLTLTVLRLPKNMMWYTFQPVDPSNSKASNTRPIMPAVTHHTSLHDGPS